SQHDRVHPVWAKKDIRSLHLDAVLQLLTNKDGILERFKIDVRQAPVVVCVEPVEYADQVRYFLGVLPADEAIVIGIEALEVLGNFLLVLQVHRKKVVNTQHHGSKQNEPDPVLATGIAQSLPGVLKDNQGSSSHEKRREDRCQ